MYAETTFVMFVAKNNEPCSIGDGFSKIGSDMSSDSELAKKYEAGKTKTTEIIKAKRNHLSVSKNPNVHSVCLRK